MSFGKMLDDQLDLVTASETLDGRGGVAKTWAAAAGDSGIACRVEVVGETDRTRDDLKLEYVYTHAFLIRPRAAKIDQKKMRIEWGGEAYEIVTVAPVGGRRGAHHWRVLTRRVE